jgi:hypothetical protein
MHFITSHAAFHRVTQEFTREFYVIFAGGHYASAIPAQKAIWLNY